MNNCNLKKLLPTFHTTLISTCLIINISSAQTNTRVFNHITVDNGLSQNSVNCIMQDHYGFMWFGTQDGLNRYDGKNFMIFHNNPKDKNSISNNYIWTIYEDRDGILWIGTFGGGLNSYDPVKNRFTHYDLKLNDTSSVFAKSFFDIKEDKKGILWLASDEGLIKLNKETGEHDYVFSHFGTSPTELLVYTGSIAMDDSGLIYTTTNKGIGIYDSHNNTLNFYDRSPWQSKFDLSKSSKVFYQENLLYITGSNGLISIDLSTQEEKVVLSTDEIQSDQNIVFGNYLIADDGTFMIGSNVGLIIYDPLKKNIEYYNHTVNNPSGLSHNSIFSIVQSQDGVAWIGTRSGLNKLDKLKPDFQLMRNIVGEESLSNNSIKCITSHNEYLWIGTIEGLNIYNRNTKKIYTYLKDNSALTSEYVLCIKEDKNGDIWLGTRGGGLYKIRTERYINFLKFKIQKINPENFDLQHSTIYNLHFDSEGMLWAGTQGSGLLRYDVQNNLVKNYGYAEDNTGPSHSFVYGIIEDDFGNLWLGTPTGGLNLFNKKTEKFIYLKNYPDNIKSLSNDIVLSMYIDKAHYLWVGTSGGLNKFILPININVFEALNQKTNLVSDSLFIRYGRGDGLPNDVIYGILEDEQNNLWLSTNAGIIKFNQYQTPPVLKVYDAFDGLQNNEFNQNAYYKTATGEMFFGGVEGLTYFFPADISGNAFKPPVVFTQFLLFNKPVEVSNKKNAKESVLDQSIFATSEIKLNYKHDVLTIEFSALSYINAQKNKFRYKLEGFDKNWVEGGDKNSVTYTNLDAGNYSFKVMAANNDGVWNTEPSILQIHITPPPWASWYAYFIYCILIAGFIYAFIQYRVNKARQKLELAIKIEKIKIEEREIFRKKSAADFHDEAGNKITRIHLFTQLARDEAKEKPELLNYLDKIEENTKAIAGGMRDFIWVMDASKGSLYDTMVRLKKFGDNMFEGLPIQFNLKELKEEFTGINLSMNERKATLQIFKEAMNNAAKYSGADKILISANVQNNTAEIILIDNGIGFNKEIIQQKNSYGMQIMHNRAEKVNAILQIDTVEKSGTKVCLKINITHLGDTIG